MVAVITPAVVILPVSAPDNARNAPALIVRNAMLPAVEFVFPAPLSMRNVTVPEPALIDVPAPIEIVAVPASRCVLITPVARFSLARIFKSASSVSIDAFRYILRPA